MRGGPVALGWYNTSDMSSMGWTCGYCGRAVCGSVGYHRNATSDDSRVIYICPHCENPTAFVRNDSGRYEQFPDAVRGNEVGSLPPSVASLYGEVRRCIQYTAYTSAVLGMRKLLMHVAVDKGAPENCAFISYIDFLNDNGWIPPSGRDWVDAIRKGGNEATHEIVLMSEEDAVRLLDFAEMLLKIVYEFPAKINPS